MEANDRLEALRLAVELVKSGASLAEAAAFAGIEYVPQKAQESGYDGLKPFPDILSLPENVKLRVSVDLVITSVCLCKTTNSEGKEATYYHCSVVPRALGANSIIDAKLTVFDNTALFARITKATAKDAIEWTNEERAELADLEKAFAKEQDAKERTKLQKQIAKLKRVHEIQLLPAKFITQKDKENWQALRYDMTELQEPIVIIGRILYKQAIKTKQGTKYCTFVRLGCDEVIDSKGVVVMNKYGETTDEALARLATALDNKAESKMCEQSSREVLTDFESIDNYDF
jgi:hypothetical protein